jgi:hypothetical protein
LLLFQASAALAGPNDFRLYQLGNPTPGKLRYTAEANGNFRIFANELGAALTSVNLMPPSTLGHLGFAVNADLSVISFRTHSFLMPTEVPSNGAILSPSLHVRKGLPFSFELGARAGWIEQSSMVLGTVELKWAINEGFENWPDIGVRGHLTRLLNARDFELFATGVDLGVGKRFVIADTVAVTPYLGWNLVWVGAYSSAVDFNPERSYVDTISAPTAPLVDAGVFEDVAAGSNSHHRFYGGLRLASGILLVAAEVSYSSLGSFRDSGTGANRSIPSLFTFNTSFGLQL